MQTPTNQLALTIGQCATLACVLEATVPKPGNVHRGADFEDLTYPDLVLSGIAIGPEMDRAGERRLGETVLAAVQATQRIVRGNSNLGMILYLHRWLPRRRPNNWKSVFGTSWHRSHPDDARNVYEAIRVAKPGGLGASNRRTFTVMRRRA